jgi:hypothetical protein
VRGQTLYLLGCDTAELLKLAIALVHPCILLRNALSPTYLLPFI